MAAIQSHRTVKSRPPITSNPPELHKPLRERRHENLFIKPISYRWWNKLHACYDMVLEFEEEEASPVDIPESPSNTSLVEECHLVEILDGLYIGLADNKDDIDALCTFDDERFTHVVQLGYAMPSAGKHGRRRLSMFSRRGEEAPRNCGVYQLKLNGPANSRWVRPNRTVLGPKELRAARDFLTLALPHGSRKWWPEEERKDGPALQLKVDEQQTEQAVNNQGNQGYDCTDEDEDEDENAQFVTPANTAWLDALLCEETSCVPQEPEENVNVLIIAPTRRAADVHAVLFSYLAFLEDAPVRKVANMDYFDDVWQGVSLAPGAIQFVERMATSEHESRRTGTVL